MGKIKIIDERPIEDGDVYSGPPKLKIISEEPLKKKEKIFGRDPKSEDVSFSGDAAGISKEAGANPPLDLTAPKDAPVAGPQASPSPSPSPSASAPVVPKGPKENLNPSPDALQKIADLANRQAASFASALLPGRPEDPFEKNMRAQLSQKVLQKDPAAIAQVLKQERERLQQERKDLEEGEYNTKGFSLTDLGFVHPGESEVEDAFSKLDAYEEELAPIRREAAKAINLHAVEQFNNLRRGNTLSLVQAAQQVGDERRRLLADIGEEPTYQDEKDALGYALKNKVAYGFMPGRLDLNKDKYRQEHEYQNTSGLLGEVLKHNAATLDRLSEDPRVQTWLTGTREQKAALENDPVVREFQGRLNKFDQTASTLSTLPQLYPQVKYQIDRQKITDAWAEKLMADNKKMGLLSSGALHARQATVGDKLDAGDKDEVRQIAEATGLSEEEVRAHAENDDIRLKSYLGRAWFQATNMFISAGQGLNRTLLDKGHADAVNHELEAVKYKTPEAATRNWSTEKVLDLMSTGLGQFAGFVAMSGVGRLAGTGAVAAAEALAPAAAVEGAAATAARYPAIIKALKSAKEAADTYFPGYYSSYEDAYQEAARHTTDEAARQRYAASVGAANGASELILRDIDVADKLLKGVPKGQVLSRLAAGRVPFGTGDIFKAQLAEFGKILGYESLEELMPYVVETLEKNNIFDYKTSTSSFLDGGLRTIVETAVSTIPMAGLGMVGARNTSGLTAAALYEASKTPEQYRDYFENLHAEGRISQEEKNQRVQLVNTLADIAATIPSETKHGAVSEEQKARLTQLMWAQRKLQSERETVAPRFQRDYDDMIVNIQDRIDAVLNPDVKSHIEQRQIRELRSNETVARVLGNWDTWASGTYEEGTRGQELSEDARERLKNIPAALEENSRDVIEAYTEERTAYQEELDKLEAKEDKTAEDKSKIKELKTGIANYDKSIKDHTAALEHIREVNGRYAEKSDDKPGDVTNNPVGDTTEREAPQRDPEVARVLDHVEGLFGPFENPTLEQTSPNAEHSQTQNENGGESSRTGEHHQNAQGQPGQAEGRAAAAQSNSSTGVPGSNGQTQEVERDIDINELFKVGNTVMVEGKPYTVKMEGKTRKQLVDADGNTPPLLHPFQVNEDGTLKPHIAKELDYLRYQNGQREVEDRRAARQKEGTQAQQAEAKPTGAPLSTNLEAARAAAAEAEKEPAPSMQERLAQIRERQRVAEQKEKERRERNKVEGDAPIEVRIPQIRLFDLAAQDLNRAKDYIERAFSEARTPEEAKRLYRKLAMEYHPDRQGSTEAMKHLNEVKEKFDKQGYFRTAEQEREQKRAQQTRTATQQQSTSRQQTRQGSPHGFSSNWDSFFAHGHPFGSYEDAFNGDHYRKSLVRDTIHRFRNGMKDIRGNKVELSVGDFFYAVRNGLADVGLFYQFMQQPHIKKHLTMGKGQSAFLSALIKNPNLKTFLSTRIRVADLGNDAGQGMVSIDTVEDEMGYPMTLRGQQLFIMSDVLVSDYWFGKSLDKGVTPARLQEFYDTVTHEFVHRLTMKEIIENPAFTAELRPLLTRAQNYLKANRAAVRQQVLRRFTEQFKGNQKKAEAATNATMGDIDYGLSNIPEFLAMFHGNSEDSLHTFLRSVPMGKESVWTRLMNAIAKMLGRQTGLPKLSVQQELERVTTAYLQSREAKLRRIYTDAGWIVDDSVYDEHILSTKDQVRSAAFYKMAARPGTVGAHLSALQRRENLREDLRNNPAARAALGRLEASISDNVALGGSIADVAWMAIDGQQRQEPEGLTSQLLEEAARGDRAAVEEIMRITGAQLDQHAARVDANRTTFEKVVDGISDAYLNNLPEVGRLATFDVRDPMSDEVLVEAGDRITPAHVRALMKAGVEQVSVLKDGIDMNTPLNADQQRDAAALSTTKPFASWAKPASATTAQEAKGEGSSRDQLRRYHDLLKIAKEYIRRGDTNPVTFLNDPDIHTLFGVQEAKELNPGQIRRLVGSQGIFNQSEAQVDLLLDATAAALKKGATMDAFEEAFKKVKTKYEKKEKAPDEALRPRMRTVFNEEKGVWELKPKEEVEDYERKKAGFLETLRAWTPIFDDSEVTVQEVQKLHAARGFIIDPADYQRGTGKLLLSRLSMQHLISDGLATFGSQFLNVAGEFVRDTNGNLMARNALWRALMDAGTYPLDVINNMRPLDADLATQTAMSMNLRRREGRLLNESGDIVLNQAFGTLGDSIQAVVDAVEEAADSNEVDEVQQAHEEGLTEEQAEAQIEEVQARKGKPQNGKSQITRDSLAAVKAKATAALEELKTTHNINAEKADDVKRGVIEAIREKMRKVKC